MTHFFFFQPHARDFNMLINLLAESQGLPESLRILALFEHQFAMLWEPNNIRLTQKMPLPSPVGSNLNGDSKKDPGEKKDPKKDSDEFGLLGLDKGAKLQSLIVTWDDADIADYFHK